MEEAVCADGQLLQRHLRGEDGAFAELMRSYANPIYGYLTRCGVPASDRDDLFQDIFCRVHGAASGFSPERPFRPWLFAIVVNRARTYFKTLPHPIVAQLSAVPGDPSDPGPDPHDVAEVRETARWLESEIARLPLAQREVVVLSCVQNLPHQEIAGALGIPVNTVKTHLRRARISLAGALARRNRALGREVSR